MPLIDHVWPPCPGGPARACPRRLAGPPGRGARSFAAALLVLALVAAAASAEGVEEHAHGGHKHHSMMMLTHGGTVLFNMPDFDVHLATTAQRVNAERLLARTRDAAGRLFPTLAAAQRRGYAGNPGRTWVWKWVGDHYVKAPGQPRLLHLSRVSYTRDRHVLDPWRPESLVYLRQATGWRLVAFMYRARAGRVPTPGGLITRWHVHGGCAAPSFVPRLNVTVRDPRCPPGQVLHYGRLAMMHVWLADTLPVGFSMQPPPVLVPPGTLGAQ